MRTSGSIAAAALAVALLLAGCSGTPAGSGTPASSGTPGPTPTTTAVVTPTPSPVPTPSPSPSPTPEPTPAFSCPLAKTTLQVPTNEIIRLRVTRHDGYDQVSFEFGPMGEGSGASATVELAPDTPPFRLSPSDLPVTVAGDRFLRVIFRETILYDESGTPVFIGSTDLKPDGGIVREVVQVEAFEGVVQWLIGAAGEGCARVAVDAAGSRLLIDFRAP